jgi:hypothetical protein
VPDAPVRVHAAEGWGPGARWQVETERDAGPYTAGTRFECRVDAPPEAGPRAEISCALPGGGRVALGEPDGRPGVLPVDIRVRTLRLFLSRESR